MQKIRIKYKDLSDSDYGALTKMMDDYETYGKAETNNKEIKILFYSTIKKEMDKVLKERNRKKVKNNGR